MRYAGGLNENQLLSLFPLLYASRRLCIGVKENSRKISENKFIAPTLFHTEVYIDFSLLQKLLQRKRIEVKTFSGATNILPNIDSGFRVIVTRNDI